MFPSLGITGEVKSACLEWLGTVTHQQQEFSVVAGESPGLGCSDRQGGSLDGLDRCQVWMEKGELWSGGCGLEGWDINLVRGS